MPRQALPGSKGRGRRFESDDLLPREMQRLGRYTNPSSALQAIFDALPDEPIKPSVPPPPPLEMPTDRLGNGEIKRAAVKVLAATTEPLSIADVHRGVERLLGHPVLKESVGWCLAAGARRRKPQFERVSAGVYRLSPR
jgi:hypothetical protein